MLKVGLLLGARKLIPLCLSIKYSGFVRIAEFRSQNQDGSVKKFAKLVSC